MALYLFMSDQKVEAENRPADGRVTEAPAAREPSNPATNPWTWNRGRNYNGRVGLGEFVDGFDVLDGGV